MTDLDTHCRTVLAAIIPDRRDLLDVALQHITPEFFPDQYLANIFKFLTNYAQVTNGVATCAAFSGALSKKADAGTVAYYAEIFTGLEEQSASEADFRWALQEVRDLAAERETGEAIKAAIEIYQSGKTDESGNYLKGHAEARTYLSERFSEIEKGLARQSSPEGNVRVEGSLFIANYLERKHAHLTGASPGVMFGIEALDAVIGGFQRGDLALLVGATSTGKTASCVQLGWSAVAEQGKNVVILTTETQRDQVFRKLIARHSRLPQFGLAEGLNSRDLKDGTLSESDEQVLYEVIRDWENNPNYGISYIAQVPQGATIASIESQLYRLQRMFNIDLVIIDYLRLLSANKRRQSDREELNQILIMSKQLATTFNDGVGIPVISPWQVSRAQQEIAQKAGYYVLSALSETSEASNTPDIIVPFLLPGDNEARSRYVELRGQVLKNRDGETAAGIMIDVDYGTSYFKSKRSHNLNTLVQTSPEDQFAGLLS